MSLFDNCFNLPAFSKTAISRKCVSMDVAGFDIDFLFLTKLLSDHLSIKKKKIVKIFSFPAIFDSENENNKRSAASFSMKATKKNIQIK